LKRTGWLLLLFFFARVGELHGLLVPHTLGPDVQDNVTVKLQRKMVTGGKNFTVYIL